MSDEQGGRVRPLRRGDVARVAELRFKYLAETARLDARLRLLPEARDRVSQAVAAWHGQEDLIVLVAEAPSATPAPADAPPDGGPLLGYAVGRSSIWPPIWKTQHVGEVTEVFVPPEARGKGVGRALLAALCHALSRRGAEVLRASVPAKNAPSLGRFEALRFSPLLRVMERPVDAR
jgi:ribosomal protein S18 acetylase RimI-like enzyme